MTDSFRVELRNVTKRFGEMIAEIFRRPSFFIWFAAMFLNSRRGVPSYRAISTFDWDVAPLPQGRERAGGAEGHLLGDALLGHLVREHDVEVEVERDGEVEVEVGRLEVVDPHAVDEHQDLTER